MKLKNSNTSLKILKVLALSLLLGTPGFANNLTAAYVNANFRYSVACVGQTVQFFDETMPTDNDKIVSWFWSFGDNTGPAMQISPRSTSARPYTDPEMRNGFPLRVQFCMIRKFLF